MQTEDAISRYDVRCVFCRYTVKYGETKGLLIQEKNSRRNVSQHRPQKYPSKSAGSDMKVSSQILVCGNTVATLFSSKFASSEQCLVLLLI